MCSQTWMHIYTHTALKYCPLSSVFAHLLISVILLFMKVVLSKASNTPAPVHSGIRCDPVECSGRSPERGLQVHEMSGQTITKFPAWLLCMSQSSSSGNWWHSKTKCVCWAYFIHDKSFSDLPFHSLLVFL